MQKKSFLVINSTFSPICLNRPNLIMILTDEHNLRTLGCYRDQLQGEQAHIWGEGVQVDTPHLDRLAAEGALFTNYYTVAPLCTPSRASFMTGLYPTKTVSNTTIFIINVKVLCVLSC